MAIYTLGSSAPWNEAASNSYDELCFVCGRSLGKNPYYMHVNTSWEIISREDTTDSQGCFPVGSTCASKFAPGVLFRLEA